MVVHRYQLKPVGGVSGMLKRTSFIVAGASLAIMSCAIAGGDPDANANASGTNNTSSANTSSAQTTTSSGSAKAVDRL